MHECSIIESSIIFKPACFLGRDWNNAAYGKESTRSGISDGRECVTGTTPWLWSSDLKYNPGQVCPELPHDEIRILETKGKLPLIGFHQATVDICSRDLLNCGLGLSRWRRKRSRRKRYFWHFSTTLIWLHGHFTGRFSTCKCLWCSSFLNMWYVGREKCRWLPQSRQQTA